MAFDIGEEIFSRSRNGKEGDVDAERRLARLLVGGSMIRRRRLRALLLAHLFREGREEDEEGEGEEGGRDEERRLVRLMLAGGMVRRRRLRRLLLAHLLGERRHERQHATPEASA